MRDEPGPAGRRGFLEVVLESAPDAIITLDSRHRIIDWNRGATELFGYSKDEVAGRNVDELITGPDVEDEARGYTERVLGGGRIPPVETVRYRRDGSRVDVLLSGAPIIVDGELLGVIGVYTDITERKKYESELLKSRRLESVGTLAGGIAHDFNNLLSGISGNISLIAEHIPEDSPARKHLSAVERAMTRAVALTHQLLTFAKGSEPVVEPLETAGILMESVRFNLAGSPVKPVFRLQQDLWWIKADSCQISEVIANLVMNSKEAMPEGGELLVSAGNLSAGEAAAVGLEEGKYIRLDITDQGEGIEEEHMDRIFEPFYSTRENGSGLGLAVVHSIVSKHGGCTRVASSPGKGTRVSVYLPALDGGPYPAGTDGAGHRGASGSGRCRVLVMDDEEYIREVASDMLETMGHSVDGAENGRRAVCMYRESMESGTGYDMVILDLTVPGSMGGRETAEEILKLDGDAVIVVSSGYSTDPVMADHRSYGFCGVLAKPYTLSDMRNLVADFLE